MKRGGNHPVLVLSATLAAVVGAAGRRVIRVGGTTELASQFRSGSATVAVIEADDVSDELATVVETRGGALLVVGGTAGDAYAGGATHHLSRPIDGQAFVDALCFAERHVERVAAADRRTLPGWADPKVQELVEDAREAGAGAVVVAALSRLDLANAAHGRATVDAMLEEAAARIADTVPEAAVARLDGARFAMAVAGDGAAAGAALGEVLARPFVAGERLASVGARVGVARWEPGDDAARVLRRAFDAIGGGRPADMAGMRLAAPGVPIDALATDLHRAIDRDEIDLRFQPQVELASGHITGVEALARWDHPEHGSLGADALFAAVDRADLGLALSDHIQALALARAAAWGAPLDGLRLSVNLTAADVARSGFARTFLDRVAASGFPADRLTVEITETGLIEDLGAAARLLDELRLAGCRVAIDDFGTGYSSLAYLTALPLDYLKLDKALTHGIDGSPRERVVVRGTVAMAKQLGLAVIAEGVETRAQRYQLAALGCDLYQGFLCAGPLEEAALAALMEGETCG